MLKVHTIYILMLTAKLVECELTRQFPIESENEKLFHKDLIRKFYQQKPFEGILMLNEGNKYLYCHNLLEWINI